MKKLTLCLVAAGLAVSSLGAYAALPTSAAPFQVVVPNLKSGVMFTLEGLYLQPTQQDLGYSIALVDTGGGVGTTAETTTRTTVTTANIKPKYEFGFRVGVGYTLPNSGNDIQAAWTHFDHAYDDSTVYSGPAILSDTHKDEVRGTPVRTDTGNVSFKYDAIDLDFGQYVSVGTRLQTRLFIGLRGAELKSNSNTTSVDSSNPPILNPTTFTTDSNSKFIGAGPRAGFDTSYHLGDCFGIVGHFAAALLVGNMEESTTNLTITAPGSIDSTSNKPADLVTTVVNFNRDSQTRVVPAFDAKLGVDYTFLFPNKASSMSIEAGYQATQYLNVVSRAPFIPTTAKDSSIGFNGPYLSLNFKV